MINRPLKTCQFKNSFVLNGGSRTTPTPVLKKKVGVVYAKFCLLNTDMLQI